MVQTIQAFELGGQYLLATAAYEKSGHTSVKLWTAVHLKRERISYSLLRRVLILSFSLPLLILLLHTMPKVDSGISSNKAYVSLIWDNFWLRCELPFRLAS
jgi:hypothetical protein